MYCARNIETAQWHAVKIMEKPKDFKSPEERELDHIEREAEILISVDHVSDMLQLDNLVLMGVTLVCSR